MPPAALLAVLEQDIQQDRGGLPSHQALTKLGEHRGIKAGISEVQAERVFPINAPSHRFSGLPVGESFHKLQDHHHR